MAKKRNGKNTNNDNNSVDKNAPVESPAPQSVIDANADTAADLPLPAPVPTPSVKPPVSTPQQPPLRKTFKRKAIPLYKKKKFRQNALKTLFSSAVAGVATFVALNMKMPTFLTPEPPAPVITNVVKTNHHFDLKAFVRHYFTADERRANIFYSQREQSIAEFRRLRGDNTTRGALKNEERAFIRGITTKAQTEAKKYGLKWQEMATFRFAAAVAGIDPDTMLASLSREMNGFSGTGVIDTNAADPFRFSTQEWLYLVKEYGTAHGLQNFADNIHMTPVDSALVSVEAAHTLALRQTVDLQKNPRVLLIMGAAFLKAQDHLPTVTYAGFDAMPTYDPAVHERQKALQLLGFDIGARHPDGLDDPLTAAALREFSRIVGISGARAADEHQILVDMAADAVADSERYSKGRLYVPPREAFAIRHASQLVGVEYGYMMELAATESSFTSNVRSSKSSATGSFQFIDDTWLRMVCKHADKYGLTPLRAHMTISGNANNPSAVKINDPFLAHHTLNMRKVSYLSALMGAESLRSNLQNLQAAFPNRKLSRTDRYLAHFMGDGGALQFIRSMDRNPHVPAHTLFREAARSNHEVFFDKQGRPRSLAQIHKMFSRKFNSNRFDKQPPAQRRATPPRNNRRSS